MKRFFVKISSIALLLGLFACGNTQKAAPKMGKPTVLVSIAPYAYFVEQIAKDAVDIELLVPQGADPHTYEPTPKQVSAAHQAKLWVRIGDPFEEKILKVLQKQNANLRTIQMWEELPLIQMQEHDHNCDHSSGHAHSHSDEALDKHVWLSARLAKIQAERIERELALLFPEARATFENNLNIFLTQLAALDAEMTTLLSPLKGKALLVSHPAFGYFCQDYQLTQVAIEGEGKEALPQKVAETLKDASSLDARCVITQGQYSTKAAELVAKKLGLSIFSIDPYARDYFENLRTLAKILATAEGDARNSH